MKQKNFENWGIWVAGMTKTLAILTLCLREAGTAVYRKYLAISMAATSLWRNVKERFLCEIMTAEYFL